MTELLGNLDAPSDAELISRVRGGDLEAYGDLFSRHVDAARRLARQLTRGGEADDLVSDAFSKVMGVLQAGGGPDVAFRAYLLTSVRRLHVDRIRATARLTTTDDMELFDPGVPFQDTAVEQFESGAAARAFASLPERWQLVLWHLEVENQKPADIAPLLGMSANSVSALAYRAREGLRQAFLSAHLAETTEAECRWVTEHLGSYVRKGLAKRDNARIAAHLDECRSCTAMYLELTEVNSNLRGIIAPLLLGSLAAGYAAKAGAGAGGVVMLIGRARDVALANLTPVVAGAAATSVAVATIAAVTLGGRDAPAPAPRAPSAPSALEDQPGTVVPGSSAGGDTTRRRDQRQPTPRGLVGSPSPSTAPTGLPGDVLLGTPAIARPPAPQPDGSTPGDGRPGTGQPSDGPSETPSSPQNPAPGNPPGNPGPSEPPPSPLSADVRVSSVAISADNAVVVDLDGLPDERVTIVVDLTSTSGRTTFATQDGSCPVTPVNREQALCTTPAVRTTGMTSAAGGFRATLPLAFPDDLQSDRLRIDVRLTGYRESNPGDNSRSVDFVPHRPAPPARDIALGLRSNGVGELIGRFRATVQPLDPHSSPTTLHFQVAFSDSRVDFERIPQSCRYPDGQRTLIECLGRGTRFHGTFGADLRRLSKGDSVTVTLTVSIPGVDDPRPAGNTRSITLERKGSPRPGHGPH